ncbi:MAG TPA: bifunctional phosphopantothenoylcysteine decarboxylase/phosphopantothenate--cysteine ligase CoaBC [Nitrosomonas europaea]|uniref:Coenzyme A biosynthesis bifunctional protein CoaBC n=1 Tax=Nitrosomonas europaea (strain ATCC 19718 / CIP 103999 / KCTC 2705 / NBRC 14298) TaxID=228410 RepID=Q82UM0_NITEU|nr:MULTISPECIES: bifunctional phosphopantothenoylcysteine decarboxylase/phosphopantothenate--cysteine ligase CoaBC [Nitrosomonas]MEB2330697.1 bifunctional phosphopantothenoylcysteine decarboxylase/phosphopantothenate--cysteine ligase CoaBC [Nitrosomonas sp.]CAD85374.1 Flavoprotein [Nitrosomonas europaea ATCC 19718]SDW11769.1 Phosphopantothenate-cysteine ligase /Phosphopantothenoylcysteine decarboxylase [Nitrosomonas europaea]SES74555.1 Phosphopantothenate-cysteine ligase /Phosphopantothenoylcys
MILVDALAGKRLLLGITGGIAAYKAAELVRLLMQEGVEVQVVMTESACRFVGTATLQGLTGRQVFTELWDTGMLNGMAHINLSREVDALLIAPASADFIAKIAHGLADDLLSALCLARDCPLLIAPAMNVQMWENAATRRNLATLRQDGVTVLGPGSGYQACGEIGEGRMLEPEDLLDKVRCFFQPKYLSGKRVLVTAGPTFEALDAVRGLTNLSSGKTGIAIAQAALEAGAQVTLVCGPVCPPFPAVDKLTHIVSASEMFSAVKAEVEGHDIFISVAAVADYRPAECHPSKLKKTVADITLTLVPNPDILQYVANLPNPPFCVGFAAETEAIEQYAAEKRKRKKLPLIVANNAVETIGSNESSLILLDDEGTHYLPKANKNIQARLVMAHIAHLYDKRKGYTHHNETS